MITDEQLKDLEKYKGQSMFTCTKCGSTYGLKKERCTACNWGHLVPVGQILSGEVEVRTTCITGLMFGTRKHPQT